MRTGSCLCGAVRYTVQGEPVHVGRCHCTDCRKESGSTYTIYGHWPRDRFELTGELATHDGRSFTGLLAKRDGKQVILRDAENKEVVLAADNVEAVQPSRLSLMPDGLVSGLTPQQAADLLEFLATRK